MNPHACFGNRFRSKLRGIKPSAVRYSPTCPIPLRFAFGIGVSTIKIANIFYATHVDENLRQMSNKELQNGR